MKDKTKDEDCTKMKKRLYSFNKSLKAFLYPFSTSDHNLYERFV